MDFMQTERLLLFPLTKSYCSDEYLSWINDDEIIHFMEQKKGSTIQDLKEYLHSIEVNKILAWAIIIRENNKHIGNIKINPIDYKHGHGEYGIMIGDKNSWGKGYAKEASEKIISYCFENLNLRKINLGVIKNNKRGIKLYESLGFVKEGLFKNHRVYEGYYYDEIRMTLFK